MCQLNKFKITCKFYLTDELDSTDLKHNRKKLVLLCRIAWKIIYKHKKPEIDYFFSFHSRNLKKQLEHKLTPWKQQNNKFFIKFHSWFLICSFALILFFFAKQFSISIIWLKIHLFKFGLGSYSEFFLQTSLLYYWISPSWFSSFFTCKVINNFVTLRNILPYI